MRIDSEFIPLFTSQPSDAGRRVLARPAEPSTLMETEGAPDRPEGGGFGDLLRDALARVNETQQTADAAVRRVATGDAESLHEAIIALEKADLALRLTAQVTQRAVEAYREVSRIQL